MSNETELIEEIANRNYTVSLKTEREFAQDIVNRLKAQLRDKVIGEVCKIDAKSYDEKRGWLIGRIEAIEAIKKVFDDE